MFTLTKNADLATRLENNPVPARPGTEYRVLPTLVFNGLDRVSKTTSKEKVMEATDRVLRLNQSQELTERVIEPSGRTFADVITKDIQTGDKLIVGKKEYRILEVANWDLNQSSLLVKHLDDVSKFSVCQLSGKMEIINGQANLKSIQVGSMVKISLSTMAGVLCNRDIQSSISLDKLKKLSDSITENFEYYSLERGKLEEMYEAMKIDLAKYNLTPPSKEEFINSHLHL